MRLLFQERFGMLLNRNWSAEESSPVRVASIQNRIGSAESANAASVDSVTSMQAHQATITGILAAETDSLTVKMSAQHLRAR